MQNNIAKHQALCPSALTTQRIALSQNGHRTAEVRGVSTAINAVTEKPEEALDNRQRNTNGHFAKCMVLATQMHSKGKTIVKSHFALLLTRDVELEHESAIAAAASGGRLMLARTAGEALQSVCEHGREIDLVVIDFDNGTRGMMLLSALNMLRDQPPIVALTSTARDHSAVLAYVDGAACCLSKPMNAVELEMVIRLLGRRRVYRKENQNHANS